MKNNTQELKNSLINAEVENDSEDFLTAYRTLRRGVLKYLGISMQDINDAVNKIIEEKNELKQS